MTPPSTVESPRLFPTQRYRDAEAALRWLTEVVGFREHAVHREGGIVAHAELALGSSILMIGQHRDDPHDARIGDSRARRTDALYAAVDDVEALHARVVASGVEADPVQGTDYGSREFTCRDPEGHLWSFGTYRPRADGVAEPKPDE